MRVLLGIILGAVLTVGTAYLYDSSQAAVAAINPAQAGRQLVNWDLVASKWDYLSTRARDEWQKIAKSS